MRYDLTKLYVVCSNNGSDDCGHSVKDDQAPVPISREDLIAFALLTGSDLAGNGLPNVGGKKAIRFIAECKRTNPLSLQTAAIDELKSWARAAKYSHQLEPIHKSSEVKCCSGCGHGKNERSITSNTGACAAAPSQENLVLTYRMALAQSVAQAAVTAALKKRWPASAPRSPPSPTTIVVSGAKGIMSNGKPISPGSVATVVVTGATFQSRSTARRSRCSVHLWLVIISQARNRTSMAFKDLRHDQVLRVRGTVSPCRRWSYAPLVFGANVSSLHDSMENSPRGSGSREFPPWAITS